MALQRSRQDGYPYSETGTFSDLGLSSDRLATLAVTLAKGSVEALEEFGFEPSDELRKRAAGDPDLVAAFVAAYSTPGEENAVA